MNVLMKRADEIVQNVLLPAITGETKRKRIISITSSIRRLRYSHYLVKKTCNELENSLAIISPLVAPYHHSRYKLPNAEEIKEATKNHNAKKTEQLTNKSSKIEVNMDPETKRAVIQAKEKDASSWLTVLPIEEHEFTLIKNEFRDVIHLRYKKTLKGMPSQYPCGHNYDVTHAMKCKNGGFVIMRHN